MSRTFTVTVPDDCSVGKVFAAIVDSIEPKASEHTLITHTDEHLRLSVTHSRLGVTVRDVTEP